MSDLSLYWHYTLIGFTFVVAVAASGHAVVYKRDPKSAALWVGIITLIPLVGSALYFLLGINRIRRRAVSIRGDLTQYSSPPQVPPCKPGDLISRVECSEHFAPLAELMEGVTERPLLPGNAVEVLVDGDEAYPEMLKAIHAAERSISFTSYLFDRSAIGEEFVEAFGDAIRRGVEVRVLIDATGAKYSIPTIFGRLRQAGIPFGRFLPTSALRRPLTFNLHNHRKILVVDGKLGFTGGINIRPGNLLANSPRHPVKDLHFKIAGPVVAHLQETFVDDWMFSTKEPLRGELWFPDIKAVGGVVARGIADGPDEDMDKIIWAILSALNAARSSVYILTPYFLPNTPIIAALNLASMRGVDVNIVLPAKNNLPFVQWATNAMLWQILKHRCRVWLTPPPFDHTKLMLVDESWAMIGSSNWDPRSLRLNFEFNLECYSDALGRNLMRIIETKMRPAAALTRAQLDSRSFPIKLRDGITRLFTPFL